MYYHPSGALGKQLTRVKDIMIKKRDVPFINENMSVKNAIIEITKKTLGCVLVRNSNQKKLLESLTDGDVRRSNK